MELKPAVYKKITDLCSEGNELADKGDYDGALSLFTQALKALPSPHYNWEAGTWLYTSIGDMLYLTEDYETAITSFNEAMKCPDGIANPFIRLRLGECCEILGYHDLAKEHLMSAYMLEGRDIFTGDDEKYYWLIADMI